MQVTIRLTAHLKQFGPSNANLFSINMGPAATVGDVVGQLGIPVHVERIILINGKRRGENDPLNDGDLVTFIVPMTGG